MHLFYNIAYPGYPVLPNYYAPRTFVAAANTAAMTPMSAPSAPAIPVSPRQTFAPTTFMSASWLPPAYVFEQKRIPPPTMPQTMMKFITGFPSATGRMMMQFLTPPPPPRSIFVGVKG
ncbi:hypothetical protein ACHOLT_04930 [Desulfitobacterium sp. Sab5]|uniref:hypothetical protein n=1 Tax=Desulfitobacterium nosdiversum TaxID=3375356 RepID=UPI003CFAF60B